MATTDSLRVGDAEREAVAAELREHYAQGRLTLEDFNRRLDAALSARTRGDLDRLIADLPHARPAGAPLPAPGGSWQQHSRGGPGFGGSALLGRIASLVAALASLLIVFDFMGALRWPVPGKIGILLGIFALIRGLLRRLVGGARRRFMN